LDIGLASVKLAHTNASWSDEGGESVTRLLTKVQIDRMKLEY